MSHSAADEPVAGSSNAAADALAESKYAQQQQDITMNKAPARSNMKQPQMSKDACGPTRERLAENLRAAAAEGKVELARLLLRCGAEPNAQDEQFGNTPLHQAAWNGFSETVQMLCKYRANTSIKNKAQFTPLHMAAQQGHNQSARILLMANARTEARNSYGDTPLHTAARYGHAGVARILLSAKCNPNQVNKNHDTPLHIAAAMARRKLTKIFMQNGAEPSIKNKQNETAMDIALRKDLIHIQELIANPPPVSPRNSQRRDSSTPPPPPHCDNKQVRRLLAEVLAAEQRYQSATQLAAASHRHHRQRRNGHKSRHMHIDDAASSQASDAHNDTVDALERRLARLVLRTPSTTTNGDTQTAAAKLPNELAVDVPAQQLVSARLLRRDMLRQRTRTMSPSALGELSAMQRRRTAASCVQLDAHAPLPIAHTTSGACPPDARPPIDGPPAHQQPVIPVQQAKRASPCASVRSSTMSRARQAQLRHRLRLVQGPQFATAAALRKAAAVQTAAADKEQQQPQKSRSIVGKLSLLRLRQMMAKRAANVAAVQQTEQQQQQQQQQHQDEASVCASQCEQQQQQQQQLSGKTASAGGRRQERLVAADEAGKRAPNGAQLRLTSALAALDDDTQLYAIPKKSKFNAALAKQQVASAASSAAADVAGAAPKTQHEPSEQQHDGEQLAQGQQVRDAHQDSVAVAAAEPIASQPEAPAPTRAQNEQQQQQQQSGAVQTTDANTHLPCLCNGTPTTDAQDRKLFVDEPSAVVAETAKVTPNCGSIQQQPTATTTTTTTLTGCEERSIDCAAIQQQQQQQRRPQQVSSATAKCADGRLSTASKLRQLFHLESRNKSTTNNSGSGGGNKCDDDSAANCAQPAAIVAPIVVRSQGQQVKTNDAASLCAIAGGYYAYASPALRQQQQQQQHQQSDSDFASVAAISTGEPINNHSSGDNQVQRRASWLRSKFSLSTSSLIAQQQQQQQQQQLRCNRESDHDGDDDDDIDDENNGGLSRWQRRQQPTFIRPKSALSAASAELIAAQKNLAAAAAAKVRRNIQAKQALAGEAQNQQQQQLTVKTNGEPFWSRLHQARPNALEANGGAGQASSTGDSSPSQNGADSDNSMQTISGNSIHTADSGNASSETVRKQSSTTTATGEPASSGALKQASGDAGARLGLLSRILLSSTKQNGSKQHLNESTAATNGSLHSNSPASNSALSSPAGSRTSTNGVAQKLDQLGSRSRCPIMLTKSNELAGEPASSSSGLSSSSSSGAECGATGAQNKAAIKTAETPKQLAADAMGAIMTNGLPTIGSAYAQQQQHRQLCNLHTNAIYNLQQQQQQPIFGPFGRYEPVPQPAPRSLQQQHKDNFECYAEHQVASDFYLAESVYAGLAPSARVGHHYYTPQQPVYSHQPLPSATGLNRCASALSQPMTSNLAQRQRQNTLQQQSQQSRYLDNYTQHQDTATILQQQQYPRRPKSSLDAIHLQANKSADGHHRQFSATHSQYYMDHAQNGYGELAPNAHDVADNSIYAGQHLSSFGFGRSSELTVLPASVVPAHCNPRSSTSTCCSASAGSSPSSSAGDSTGSTAAAAAVAQVTSVSSASSATKANSTAKHTPYKSLVHVNGGSATTQLVNKQHQSTDDTNAKQDQQHDAISIVL